MLPMNGPSGALASFFGFFSGWALLVAAMVFMVTGSVPLGTATIDLINPALASNVLLTTVIGAVWFIAIGVVLITGIELTSKIQVVMSSIELLILAVISIAAFVHTGAGGTVTPFSWSWFGFNYPAGTFASSALIVVFLYWGWDVTSNLSEETKGHPPNAAGNGGFYSVFVTIASFVAFTVARALMMFSLSTASGFSDNLNLPRRLASWVGAVLVAWRHRLHSYYPAWRHWKQRCCNSRAPCLPWAATAPLPSTFGVVQEKTRTPVRTMYLLLVVGLIMIFASSFMPSIATILGDSVSAIAVQVCYYYGLAGLVCAWLYRASFKQSFGTWLGYALFPFLSAISLFVLGIYAIIGYNAVTRWVGIGGLLIGIIFFRPSGYGTHVRDILAEE